MARPTPAERFAAKVDRSGPNGCWLWTGSCLSNGYGQFRASSRQVVKAHRFAYEQAHGPIEDDLTIDHLCGERRCVNPEHLEPVTRGENTRRARAMANSTWVELPADLADRITADAKAAGVLPHEFLESSIYAPPGTVYPPARPRAASAPTSSSRRGPRRAPEPTSSDGGRCACPSPTLSRAASNVCTTCHRVRR